MVNFISAIREYFSWECLTKWKRLLKASVTLVIERLFCLRLRMAVILFGLCRWRVLKNLTLSGFAAMTI